MGSAATSSGLSSAGKNLEEVDRMSRHLLKRFWITCAETVWSNVTLYGVATIRKPSFAKSSMKKLGSRMHTHTHPPTHPPIPSSIPHSQHPSDHVQKATTMVDFFYEIAEKSAQQRWWCNIPVGDIRSCTDKSSTQEMNESFGLALWWVNKAVTNSLVWWWCTNSLHTFSCCCLWYASCFETVYLLNWWFSLLRWFTLEKLVGLKGGNHQPHFGKKRVSSSLY